MYHSIRMANNFNEVSFVIWAKIELESDINDDTSTQHPLAATKAWEMKRKRTCEKIYFKRILTAPGTLPPAPTPPLKVESYFINSIVKKMVIITQRFQNLILISDG